MAQCVDMNMKSGGFGLICFLVWEGFVWVDGGVCFFLVPEAVEVPHFF